MRIAFTHNLQRTQAEAEAEFDTPETVAMIADALGSLGHEVEPVEVSGPASRTVARLEALSPDLVFNTAEGASGRFREAFYPALFDRLGLPFTGSDAYVCTITLDKQLTKTVLAEHGVRSPRGVVVQRCSQLLLEGWRFPVIVKPNCEGSSMGIAVDSVVESQNELRNRVEHLLAAYPAGVLVEEFIAGRDLVVPFLQGTSSRTGGVLEPASYLFGPSVTAGRRHQLYDYTLKSSGSSEVEIVVPADITSSQRAKAMSAARTVFERIGVRDLGRIDFRVADDGELFFLEVNALPSLESGASIYRSAALAGMHEARDVLGAVLKSAARRYGLSLRKPRRKRFRPVVGVTYNLKRQAPTVAEDANAEFDSQATVDAVCDAIRSFDLDVVPLEATPELAQQLPERPVDVVFNMAEGLEGRGRESQVPALLELIGIPYTGSDATTLALALDKGLAKRLVREAGCQTAPFIVMRTGAERLPKDLAFPVIAKPLHEGSSKGVLATSVLQSETELRDLVCSMAERYRQQVLVENYLPGREFTVGVLGERRPRVLPPMEIVYTRPEEAFPIYSFERKLETEGLRFEVPAKVQASVARALERDARRVFAALGCRDVARIDFRLDAAGRAHFIECNPLPGLAPGFSDLVVIADAAGIDYRTLIGEILAPAMRRLKASKGGRSRAPLNGVVHPAVAV